MDFVTMTRAGTILVHLVVEAASQSLMKKASAKKDKAWIVFSLIKAALQHRAFESIPFTWCADRFMWHMQRTNCQIQIPSPRQ